MKRIRCPDCSVINLEKFVTYPHCAACGALLPETAAEVEAVLPTYRRPLKPILFAGVIGVGALALVLSAASFGPPPENIEPVTVYGRVPRVTRVGRQIEAVLMLEVLNSASHRSVSKVRGVKVRVARKFLKPFRLISVQPPPDKTNASGAGIYFWYSELPVNSEVRLKIEAAAAGVHTFDATVYASDQAVLYADGRNATQYKASIIVKPS